MTSFLPTPRLNAASMLALGILGIHISSIVVGAPLNVSDSAENNATGDSSSSNGTFFNGASIMPGCTAAVQHLMLALYYMTSVASLIALVLVIPDSSFTVVTLLVRSAPNRFTVYMCAMAVSDSITLCLALFTMIRFENNFLYQVTLNFQAVSNWILAAICLMRYVSIRFPFITPQNFHLKIVGPTVVIFVIMIIACLPGLLYMGFENEPWAQQVAASFEFLSFLCFLVILSLLSALRLKQNERSRKFMMSARSSMRYITLETQLATIMLVTVLGYVVLSSYFLLMHIFWAVLSPSSNQDTVACPSRNFASVFSLFLFWIISCVNPAVHFYTYYSFAQGFRDKRSKPRDIELSRDGCLRQS